MKIRLILGKEAYYGDLETKEEFGSNSLNSSMLEAVRSTVKL